MGKLVPGDMSKGSKGYYHCEACLAEFKVEVYPSSMQNNSLDYCPLCAALNKTPTPPLTEEQIYNKKIELKERLNK